MVVEVERLNRSDLGIFFGTAAVVTGGQEQMERFSFALVIVLNMGEGLLRRL